VQADLLQDGDFDAVMEGARFVCHLAAMVRLGAKDPQREIVDPAVNGTRNVFSAARKSGTVQRVVMTSSIAAVTDEHRPKAHVYTEADWNDSATLQSAPYHLAKTKSERAAWSFVRSLPSEGAFDLVTLNPTVVFGPVYISGHRRSSPSMLRELMVGAWPMVPDIRINVVDVRDVALAHVHAIANPRASGRYILAHADVSFQDLCAIVRDAYPHAKVPRFRAPNFAVYAIALFEKRLTWAFLRKALGTMRPIDGSKITHELGIRYRDPRKTILDTAQSFYDVGAVK